MYTSHGWPIPGTKTEWENTVKPECDGPQKCDPCDQEIWQATSIMTRKQAETKQDKARRLVFETISFIRKTHDFTLTIDGVHLVWFNYTLGDWKALVTTSLKDDIYYEVTHNADKRETYIDVYVKINNICVRDE